MAQRVGRGIALLFHDRSTRRGEWSAARPGRSLPPGKTQYPLYRRLGGPQGRSGRAEKLVPTGIRSRTVQPVVSRYTNWATGPTSSPFITKSKRKEKNTLKQTFNFQRGSDGMALIVDNNVFMQSNFMISWTISDFNHLNSTTYVMHQQFNIQQLYVLPTLYLSVFVFIWEQTATCATYSINWLVFITQI